MINLMVFNSLEAILALRPHPIVTMNDDVHNLGH